MLYYKIVQVLGVYEKLSQPLSQDVAIHPKKIPSAVLLVFLLDTSR